MTTLVAEKATRIDIADVAKDLTQESVAHNRAVRHPTRQRNNLSILKAKALNIGDGVIGVEADGQDLTVNHLRAQCPDDPGTRTGIERTARTTRNE